LRTTDADDDDGGAAAAEVEVAASAAPKASVFFLLWLPLKKASRWIVRLLTNCRGQNVYQL